MPQLIQCPSCSRKLRLPDEFIGQQVKCPTCQATFQAESAPPLQPLMPSSEPSPSEEELNPPRREDPTEQEGVKPRRRRTFEEYDEDNDDDHAYRRANRRQKALARIKPPAICMLVVASLGLLIDLFNVGFALIAKMPAAAVQRNDFFAEMQRNSVGPVAAIIQGSFAVIALVVIMGCITMLLGRNYWLAMTATILSMFHLGSCCCILLLPFSIWALVVLGQSDVRDAFH